MREFKIYTKGGDKSKTSLLDGSRVYKSDLRLNCYGTLDELNSFLGLLKDKIYTSKIEDRTALAVKLKRIQNHLFNMGCELSDPNFDPEKATIPVISSDNTLILENEIDEFQKDLKPLTNFILPGGHEINSLAHICRTICRRSERLLIELYNGDQKIRQEPIKYLNRLSDWFFVLSRYLSDSLNAEESLWEK